MEDVDEEILGIAERGTQMRRRRRRRQPWWRRVTHRPRRWVKKHKALAVLLGLLILLLVILLLFLWFLDRRLGEIPRFDTDLGNRPPASAGTTILLAGVDDGKGRDLEQMLEGEEWQQGVFRTDAMLMVHLDENGSQAAVISVPRDSYVDIEGYGRTKLNAAFSFGGPELLWQSMERFTRTRIDHMVVADFEGFKDVTETLGGIQVFVPEGSANPQGSTLLNPGWQKLKGDEALYYVRARYDLPRGDFDRVQRQQNVLRGVFDEARAFGTLANPVKLTRLVGDMAENLAVDESLTNGRLRDLALTASNLSPTQITYATIPHQGSRTIDGASVVVVVPRDVREMFSAVVDGELAAYVQKHRAELDTLPPPTEVN